MSRVIVFGADGLIGHYLVAELQAHSEVCGTLHGTAEQYPTAFFPAIQLMYDVDAADSATIRKILATFRPDWAINAIGLAKRPLTLDRTTNIEINAIFPHRLAALCGERDIRLLHFSSDCVFNGKRGNYSEADQPDGHDCYGRCKALGEASGKHVLVLRTSFIGLELSSKKGLVEWFLSQRGEIRGYTQAIWSGLTAAEIARVVARLVTASIPPTGLWHLASSQAISKFELLSALNDRLGNRGYRVVPDSSLVCDRSLNGAAFSAAFNYPPLNYSSLLDELAEEILSREHSTKN